MVLRACMCSGLLLAAMSTAAADGAEAGREVFVSIGEHGEVSFSDVASPGAERRSLPPVAPNAEALADLDRSIQQTLDVARALEASRLARERARAEARAAAAPAAPPLTYVEERYVPYPYVYAPYPRPRYPHHRPPPTEPPDGTPPPEQPRSRPFIWRND